MPVAAVQEHCFDAKDYRHTKSLCPISLTHHHYLDLDGDASVFNTNGSGLDDTEDSKRKDGFTL